MLDLKIHKEIPNSNFTLDIAFSIKEGEHIAIFGESGSGKTTALRVLAGLSKAKGYCRFKDKIFFDDTHFLPPQQRGMGFVFQDYGIFPHLNVLQNLLFVSNDEKYAKELLEEFELSPHINKNAQLLSGGQKQRLAMVRALIGKPMLLLLDEPFSALDLKLKLKLQSYLLSYVNEHNCTLILISHDVSEVYRLTNKVCALENGQMKGFGDLNELFLKTSGSRKFSLKARILKLEQADNMIEATVAIEGRQIAKVVLTKLQAKDFRENEEVNISLKAFEINLIKSS